MCSAVLRAPFPFPFAQAPTDAHTHLHTGMTKLSSLTYPAGTPTLPTFISTQRADGILISITLIEIGFFTVASEEQFPNPARGVAAKKKKMIE